MWFFGEAFRRSQEEGAIPADEKFDYRSILDIDSNEFRWKYDPSAEARRQIRLFHERGLTRDCIPDIIHCRGKQGNRNACLALLWVPDGTIMGVGSLRSIHFGHVWAGDIAGELAISAAASKLAKYANGDLNALRPDQVRDEFFRWHFGDGWEIRVKEGAWPSIRFSNKRTSVSTQSGLATSNL